MFKFLRSRKGYVMGYVTIIVATVAIPMLILSVEIVRAMNVQINLGAAVDAACEAASQAVDVPFFINNGVLQIVQGTAASYAQREFDSTVLYHNIQSYSPALTGLSYPSAAVVQCAASATMQWLLPGIPAISLHANAIAQAKVSVQ